jgi:hypothetical protein
MGHFVRRSYTRSPSRRRRPQYNTDSEDFNDSDFTDYPSRKRKRGSSLKQQRQQQHYSEEDNLELETSEESDDSVTSDVPLSKLKEYRPTASAQPSAVARLQGPIRSLREEVCTIVVILLIILLISGMIFIIAELFLESHNIPYIGGTSSCQTCSQKEQVGQD